MKRPAKHEPSGSTVHALLVEIGDLVRTAKNCNLYKGAEATAPHVREILRAAKALGAELGMTGGAVAPAEVTP
jgi:hypothetical protein